MNTATIRETGQSASTAVTVNCYELEVTKTASTSFNRTYTWAIVKKANVTELTLKIGETAVVEYNITVDATYTDSDWKVSGEITVCNPAQIAATIKNITDVVSPGIVATVDFGVTFPYTLGAGGTLKGNYTADLPNGSTRKNTATVTIQNYAYKWDGTNVPTGTTDFSVTADVDFSSAHMEEVDKRIDVSDDYAGSLGTVTYGVLLKTFTYTKTIGPYDTPGDYTVENTASFVACDTKTTGSDSWTVRVHVSPVEEAEISGVKFYDININGMRDNDDVGIAGWKIQLWKQDND